MHTLDRQGSVKIEREGGEYTILMPNCVPICKMDSACTDCALPFHFILGEHYREDSKCVLFYYFPNCLVS